MIVYALKDPRTGDVRYIGKTTKSLQRRIAEHTSPSSYRRGRNHRERWIAALIHLGMRPEAETILHASTVEEMDQAECLCIQFARDIGLTLVNATDGGDGKSGYIHSERTRQRMKEAQSSPDAIARKRAQRGKPKQAWGGKLIQSSDGRIFIGQCDAAKHLGISVRTVDRLLCGKPSKSHVRLSYV